MNEVGLSESETSLDRCYLNRVKMIYVSKILQKGTWVLKYQF